MRKGPPGAELHPFSELGVISETVRFTHLPGKWRRETVSQAKWPGDHVATEKGVSLDKKGPKVHLLVLGCSDRPCNTAQVESHLLNGRPCPVGLEAIRKMGPSPAAGPAQP